MSKTAPIGWWVDLSYDWRTAWKVSIFGIFLLRIFSHSDWIRRDTDYLSVFSPNAEKCGPEKRWIRTPFTQWQGRIDKRNYWKKERIYYRTTSMCLSSCLVLKNVFIPSLLGPLCLSLFIKHFFVYIPLGYSIFLIDDMLNGIRIL